MNELMLGTSGSLFYDNTDTVQQIRIPRETALYLFEKASIITPSLSANALGMYTFAQVGADGEAEFGSFSVPQFSLRPGSRGCVWNPSSRKITFGTDKIPTCPLEMQEEICTDMLWNSCWKRLLGIGHDKLDWDSTPEAQILLAQLIKNKLIGMGRDLYYIVTWGGHPMIEVAHKEQYWKLCGIKEADWNAFYEMMMACGGHLTNIDGLGSDNSGDHDALGLDIPESHLDATGKYIGNPTVLFDLLSDNQSSEMLAYENSMTSIGQPAISGAANPDGLKIMPVTPGIFNKYKKHLRQTFTNIDAGYYLTLYGETYGCDSCGDRRVKNTLMYDDKLVVSMTSWDIFSKMTCIKHERAMLLTPGVLGIAYDVDVRDHMGGMGMKITSWKIDPHAGKTMMSTYFRIGTKVLDTNHIVSATYYGLPQ